ncbi:MAG: hypothetical protein IPH31_09465 [Lewinellaceae bacterium]|nr:hypothetical protein [Lewinellaceae bacterium]
MQKSLACFFVLFFGSFAATAQAPALLKDINNALVNGKPRGMTTVGTTVFFSADDGLHGRELWKTTGTDASTVMVADINPSGDANPANFCNVNGIVFFTVTTPVNGTQIWKTDGTANGTKFVADILLGGESGSFAQLTACNGKLFSGLTKRWSHLLEALLHWNLNFMYPMVPLLALKYWARPSRCRKTSRRSVIHFSFRESALPAQWATNF